MDKHLVRSEKEYVALFDDFDLGDAEQFLGVEFAYQDGTYQSDLWKGKEINEEQDVNRSLYRKSEHSNFPEEYPCLVLLANERDFDRTGDTLFQYLGFVYPQDFNLNRNES